MSATILLRIAAVIAFLFAAGHTLGGRKDWSPAGPNAVLEAMRSVHFDAMGVSRSFFDFYIGFGYSLSTFLALQAVLLWQFATIARSRPTDIRPSIIAIALATAVVGVISWFLIMPLPALFSAVLSVVLATAAFAAR